jgi:hypothetical protein
MENATTHSKDKNCDFKTQITNEVPGTAIRQASSSEAIRLAMILCAYIFFFPFTNYALEQHKLPVINPAIDNHSRQSCWRDVSINADPKTLTYAFKNVYAILVCWAPIKWNWYSVKNF